MKFSQLIQSDVIEGHLKYKDAVKHNQTYEPEANVDYSWIWEYSKDSHSILLTIYKEIDEKANDIIKYLGGGTGLFSLALILKANELDKRSLALCCPSFLCVIVALFFASKVRQPGQILFPPSIKDACEYADYYKTDSAARAAMLGEWHIACQGTEVALSNKSDRLYCATWSYFLAITLLLLPLLNSIGLFSFLYNIIR